MSFPGEAPCCPFIAGCPGRLEPEFDGTCEVLACTECGNVDSDSYRLTVTGEDTCAAGLPATARQAAPRPGPEFLGSPGRRPR